MIFTRLIITGLLAFLFSPGITQTVIKGKLLDKNDSTGLPGVAIRIKGTKIGTTTTASGEFALPVPDSLIQKDSTIVLTASGVGYNITEITLVPPFKESLLVVLNPASGDLNEVVVIGYGSTDIVEKVSFPWPPPEYTTLTVLDKNLFKNAKNFGEVNKIISGAIKELHYPQIAYYYIPNGFVLVTQVEQIREDGEPLQGKDRWATTTVPLGKSGWKNYLSSILFSTPGYFRIIAFAFTNKPFSSSGKKIKKEAAQNWLHEGLSDFPPELDNKNFGRNYNCTAIIYEFKKPESNDAFLINPGSVSALEHLEKAGIMGKIKMTK